MLIEKIKGFRLQYYGITILQADWDPIKCNHIFCLCARYSSGCCVIFCDDPVQVGQKRSDNER